MGGSLCCNNQASYEQLQMQLLKNDQIKKFLSKYPILQRKFKIQQQYIPSTRLILTIKNQNKIIFLTQNNLIKPKQNSYEQLLNGIIFQQNQKINQKQQALIYQGQITKNHIKSGIGFVIFQNGQTYQGQWKDNEFNKGLYKYLQNNYYEGQFKNSLKQGKGKIIINNSSSVNFQYQGDFFKDQIRGKGKIKYNQSGQTYQGDFINCLPHGYGVYQTKLMKYQGEWKLGLMQGDGKYQWLSPQGQIMARYIGEYYKGKKHGFGQYTRGNSKILRGEWKNGKFMSLIQF